MTSDIPKDLAPRLCHITRWTDFQGYGFNLHAEKGKAGQFIGKVDEGSPAEKSGLKEGDRIVEVNGVNIGNENHQQVVTRIRQGGVETRLLVVDNSSDDWFKDNKLVIKGDLSGIVFGTSRRDVPEEESLPEPENEPEPEHEPEPEPEIEKEEEVPEVESIPPPPVTNGNGYSDDDLHKPRLCHLRLWPDFQGYGFNLHAERDKPGQYIGLVDDNSPASTAGLKVNDRIVEVNGHNIEREPHSAVIGYIKETPGEARMLVVDPETDTYYRQKGVSVHAQMSQVEYIVTPESSDAAADLEAEADLDNLPPPPEYENIPEPLKEEEEEEKEEVEFQPEPPAPVYADVYEDVNNEQNGEDGDALDAVDAILAQQDDEPEVVIPEPEVEPEPIPEPEPEPVVEAVPEPQQEVEETVNGVKRQEAPSPPEPEFTVAKEFEPVVLDAKPTPAPTPAPEPAKAPEDDGLNMNMSVAEMKERLKAKKKADPRHNKISFERKYQQFERM